MKEGVPYPTVQIEGTCVKGVFSLPSVASFLGIPFAKFPQRFRSAKLFGLNSLEDVFDAEAYGPRCPQPRNAGRERRNHLFEGVIPSSTLSMSEFDCLRLNIYTPWVSNTMLSGLPVVVWIHGGGWVFGDGNSEYGS
jgi:carboxylesterase type B